MNIDERTEVLSIEIRVRKMIYILTRYLSARILFEDERKALDWILIRIELVCRELYHDPAHTEYKLTSVERCFFMNSVEKYLKGGSYPLGCIQRGELCKVESDFYVFALIDYLASIQRECVKSESTGVLPKEESWDVEY